eukprot:COSAG02_NODE_4566_length_5212_cov_3.031293_4_plen_629_part_00
MLGCVVPVQTSPAEGKIRVFYPDLRCVPICATALLRPFSHAPPGKPLVCSTVDGELCDVQITLARACHPRRIEEVVDVGQIRQMTREAASFLPTAHSSMRTASPPPLPESSAVERMSAVSGRESMFGAQDHKLEWVQSELSSLHSSLSDERKKRMELEAKLQECFDYVRQSSTAAAADLQALSEDIDARQKADSQMVAQTVEELHEKAEAAGAQMLQLENDSSEVQTTMHMVMNMLENCIDAKEARALVDGCMRRIEESEEAIKQHVDTNKAALTAEAEDRDAQTNQTTKVAIESIEAIEAELQQHVEKLDIEVMQLKQLVSAETDRCVDSFTEKVNGDVAALEQRLRAHVEDLDRSTKAQLEQKAVQVGTTVEHYSETVRSQMDSLQKDLDSAKADLSHESKTALANAKSELRAEAKTIGDSLSMVKSSLTQNLEVKTNEIQRAIATVAVQADQALEQLQDARQHLEAKIDARSQEVSSENVALDVKYKEQCEHLRELVTNVVAEHTKHIGSLEGVQHDLRQEAIETSYDYTTEHLLAYPVFRIALLLQRGAPSWWEALRGIYYTWRCFCRRGPGRLRVQRVAAQMSPRGRALLLVYRYWGPLPWPQARSVVCDSYGTRARARFAGL